MVLGTAGLAAATHNNVGARFIVGTPDPMPTVEPDTSDDLLPIYHSADPSNTDVSQDPPFFGTYERISPADQTGLGLGDWVGYINGVVEAPGPGFPHCAAFNPDFACNHVNDPLYRVNPSASDENTECESIEDNQKLGEDETDPNDDPCAGEGHFMQVDIWPGVRVQPQHFDETGGATGSPDNSGTILPGLYGFYLYLFGDGIGVAAGQGSFDYLPTNLCEVGAGFGGAFEDGSNKPCNLIHPSDLADHDDRTHPTTGLKASPVACVFAPHFTTLSGALPGDCQDISEFNQFFAESESSTYVANKPGWYILTGFIDSGAPIASTITKTGDRTDVSRIFSFYVNPVNVDEALWCAAPMISTDADDQLDTGVEQVLDEDGNPTGDWEVTGDFDYLVEAHDLDIYTSDLGGVQRTLNELQRDIVDMLPDDLMPPEVEQAIEDANDLAGQTLDDADSTLDPVVQRVAATKGNTAERNAPGDNSWTLTGETAAQRCTLSNGLVEDTSEPNQLYNRIQATIQSTAVGSIPGGVGGIPVVGGVNFPGLGGDALRDFTDLDGDGLPTSADEQGFNPWHPESYSFSGSIAVIEDRDGDAEFDGCPAGEQPPGPGQDRCAARLYFDYTNDKALRDNSETIPDFMDQNGFRDGTGMYAVLKVSGPVAITSTDTNDLTQDNSPATILDRTRVLSGDGLHCIVALSTGLENQDDRFIDIVGASGTGDDEITDALCGEDVTGETHLLRDGFFEGDGAGGFNAAFSWTPLEPHPDALDAAGDGLTVNYLVTVDGETGDDITKANLKLGTHGIDDPTVVKVWDNGDGTEDISYLWTDFDPFTSDPDGV